MHFFYEYGLFLLQTATLVIAFLLTIAGIFAISKKEKDQNRLVIKHLNEYYQENTYMLKEKILSKKELKILFKQEKKEKQRKESKLFVLHFNGDIKASQTAQLSEQISTVLSAIQPEKDAILIKLESPGGMVPHYGLAAAELQRIRDKNVKLIISVDRVAASGGYMMAATANEIICAPFAVIGSIGVVIQLPNFNRLLKKNNIDYEQIMAGDHKRTLTLFGENTDKAREKMQDQIEEVHQLFKSFIKKFRPQLNLDEVANGDYWYGNQALELNLIDKIMTSEDYLFQARQTHEIYELTNIRKKTLAEKLSEKISLLLRGSYL